MSKLIYADIPRVLKSKILYLILILTAFMGVASVATVLLESEDKAALFPVASNNFAMFMSVMMPVFSGGLSIMLIAAEFSGGIIRNKFIMGHSRTNILMAWSVIYTFFTILTFLLYVGVFFIALLAAGADFTGVDSGSVIINLLIVLLFSLKFQMFSFLMICIYPDAKTAVICYLLNNITLVPLMLASLSDENSKAMQFLSRIFIFGYTNGEYTLSTEPDKPWLTVLLIALLAAVYMVLAILYFNKKDLK